MTEREGLCSAGNPMSLPEMFEGDLLVDDRDATVVHYRRHGSTPAAQQTCDAAVPGLASWRAGRQAWAGSQHRKLSRASPAYTEGPLFEHRIGAVPDEALNIVDRIGWAPGLTGANRVFIGHRYGGRQRLTPDVEDLLRTTADDMLATAPFGFDVEPAEIRYLTHRRPDGTEPNDAHIHSDVYDAWRRWVNLVMYFTDPAEYEGGDLIIVPTGERLRPGRGDAVLIRGDVDHRVEPLTAGARTTFTAAAGEPRWWIDPRDELEAADLDERCRVLDRLFAAGTLDRAALRRGVTLAWTAPYPQEELPVDRWVAMFRAAGFVSDHAGNKQPTRPLEVFRACDPGRERRMTWTASWPTVEWFRREYDRAEVWQATVPPEAVLAVLGTWPATEIVVDPAALEDLEQVDG